MTMRSMGRHRALVSSRLGSTSAHNPLRTTTRRPGPPRQDRCEGEERNALQTQTQRGAAHLHVADCQCTLRPPRRRLPAPCPTRCSPSPAFWCRLPRNTGSQAGRACGQTPFCACRSTKTEPKLLSSCDCECAPRRATPLAHPTFPRVLPGHRSTVRRAIPAQR